MGKNAKKRRELKAAQPKGEAGESRAKMPRAQRRKMDRVLGSLIRAQAKKAHRTEPEERVRQSLIEKGIEVVEASGYKKRKSGLVVPGA